MTSRSICRESSRNVWGSIFTLCTYLYIINRSVKFFCRFSQRHEWPGLSPVSDRGDQLYTTCDLLTHSGVHRVQVPANRSGVSSQGRWSTLCVFPPWIQTVLCAWPRQKSDYPPPIVPSISVSHRRFPEDIPTMVVLGQIWREVGNSPPTRGMGNRTSACSCRIDMLRSTGVCDEANHDTPIVVGQPRCTYRGWFRHVVEGGLCDHDQP